jgi:UDP-N-acetylmuramate dehydrogenase
MPLGGGVTHLRFSLEFISRDDSRQFPPSCCTLTKMEIQEQVSLSPYTTLGIGGPARWFAEAETESDLVDAVTWAREERLPVFVLGGGSNLLIADNGFAGLVVHVALRGIASLRDGDFCLYSVAAGEPWDAFVELAVNEDSAGIECLAGIPGTVGGTPVQNVGAYGQEVAGTIERVRVLDLETLEFHEMAAAECGFEYRKSIFNSTQKGRFLVTRVDYRLRTGGKPNLRYADVQKAFAADASPSLPEVAAEVRRIRRTKGMLLVDGDPDCLSAGSFFKNPVVPAQQFAELGLKLGAEPPCYPAGEAYVKLPAAWLIERAGFSKGFSLGRAGISSRHTLALVNLGGASARDLLALRDVIVEKVEKVFGIHLEMEPVLLGF